MQWKEEKPLVAMRAWQHAPHHRCHFCCMHLIVIAAAACALLLPQQQQHAPPHHCHHSMCLILTAAAACTSYCHNLLTLVARWAPTSLFFLYRQCMGHPTTSHPKLSQMVSGWGVMITSSTASLNQSSPNVVAVNSVLYHLKLLLSYPFYYQIDVHQTRHTSTCVDGFLAGCKSLTALNFLGATPEVNKLKWQYPHLHQKMPVELVLIKGPAEHWLLTNPIEPLIQNGCFL